LYFQHESFSGTAQLILVRLQSSSLPKIFQNLLYLSKVSSSGRFANNPGIVMPCNQSIYPRMIKALNCSLYLIVFFLFYVSLPVAIIAQTLPNKIAFEEYGVAEGLPTYFLFDVVQDKQGFIWTATENGLVKFDGYKMQVFKGNRTNGVRIRNVLGGLLLDKNGLLWIGGVGEAGGLISFDPTSEKFTKYPIDPEDVLKVPYPNCRLLFQDITGDIWFNSSPDTYIDENRILCKINAETGQVSRYPYNMGEDRYSNISLNYKMSESKKDSSLWINTDDDSKLMRYNRKKDTFELIFEKGDLLPGTQVSDSIQKVTPAGKSGLIPMGNNRHLYLFDPIERKVAQTYDFRSRKDTFWLGAIFEDELGNFWNTSYNQITRINREESTQEDFTLGKGILNFKEVLNDIRSIFPVYQDKDFIFFGIRSNAQPRTAFLRYTHKTGAFEYFDYRFNDVQNKFSPYGIVKTMLKDQSGLLWIATNSNMFKEAPKSGQIAHYTHDPEDPGSIHNDSITNLFEDSQSRLWIGTKNGISLKSSDNTFEQQYSKRTRNPKNSLGWTLRIYEDSRGRIWVTSFEKGLFRWNEQSGIFDHIPINSETKDIISILEDAQGHIWVSGLNQGVYVLDANSGKVIRKFEADKKDEHLLTSTAIFSIFKDSQDQIWLGSRTDYHGLFKYVPEKEHFMHYGSNASDSLTLSNNIVTNITEDDLGRLWVGTYEGLNLYDREKDHFLRNNDRTALPIIIGYSRGSNGKMWFSSESGDGLALVGPGVNDVELFGEEEGLLHNDILVGISSQLAVDDYGKLWLPTERGLSVLDTITKTFTSYFKEDGLQTLPDVTLKTNNGDIWIGGDEGLNQIIPRKLAAKDSTLPNIVITRMGIMDSLYAAADGTLFKNAIPYTNHVTLDYTQRDLTFEFVALHYLRPEDNLYSWKLENYDTDWSIPSKDRRAAYTNLSPGEYTFRVKGSNADGIWNEEGASIQITITPPWWFTWWAYMLYALLLGYIGYRVHLYQRARTLKKAREKAQEIELQQAKEIKKAYAELKATQTQLIQSEKMASLGELTAGIAHEIQNPLNFVNNFAEVNKELLDEMEEEIGKGNLEEVKALAKDVSENEDKILFHGKRADGIVKGMLQHSRASSGEKEATDINVLTDEYLRLAYHGLRAKDKSFNAAMETAYDKKIGKIQVVPQDLGRVILNLITNAFYAVKDKKQQIGEGYQPTVSVSTRKEGDTILVSIHDNGNGIPKKVLNKIFQPFFTTKPTGQGTGLGLSLSYDIVKAHDGEITVDTKEGEGTTFTLKLPAKG